MIVSRIATDGTAGGTNAYDERGVRIPDIVNLETDGRFTYVTTRHLDVPVYRDGALVIGAPVHLSVKRQ